MDVIITTLAERPQLAEALWFADTWPEFILNDLVGRAHFGQISQVFPEFTLVVTEPNGAVVARGHTVPFALNQEGRRDLPAGGWDQVLVWAFRDRRTGTPVDTISAIDVTVRADRLGQGLSAELLAAMRKNARSLGFAELVAPVRPTDKHLEPDTPMREYVLRTRADGLPTDPWLRTHVRAGGVIDSIAPCSMTVVGSTAQWCGWTGLLLETEGPVRVPNGLVPANCLPGGDVVSYVEPNVWIRHALT
ncbi:N-acetyltransferase [Streptomyces sp. YGL11-2]|uniref:N-acetyltransferase n=1 Tax=Streptomyces sp. YGL11-2 TaxID=3414028 RepID=UPI003CEC9BDB